MLANYFSSPLKETHLQASVSSKANISCESHHDTVVDKTKGAL